MDSLTLANSLGLFTVFVWLVGVTYTAGQRAKQMDVNTESIRDIREHGSPGVRERFNSIDLRLNSIAQDLSEQRKLIERLLERSHSI